MPSPYAARSDMELKFGPQEIERLTDVGEPRLGATNESVLYRALADASAWIDGYLVGRYSVPITESAAQQILSMHCCNVARYMLMSVQADEAATKMYESAERYFMAVGKGTINLIQPAHVPEPEGVGSVEFDPGTKHFGRAESWRDC
jgi:phage gp36-like protein